MIAKAKKKERKRGGGMTEQNDHKKSEKKRVSLQFRGRTGGEKICGKTRKGTFGQEGGL